MNCYSCGAGVSSEDPTCGHCGVRLATVACPACFSMMFREARYCPSCGSPAATWAADGSERLCPACREPMLRGQLNNTHLHECPKCFGIWLDTATFEHICRNAEQQASVLGAARALPVGPGIAPIKYQPCPECRQLMHRINFGKCSGVLVDVCRPHGTWFDAHELHHIVEFIRAGGLEQTRSREKAELVNERIRAQAARMPIEPHAVQAPSDSGLGPDLLSEVVCAAGDILFSWLNR